MNQNLEKNFVSAVVYVHDNEKEVEDFLKALYSELQAHFAKYEIIMVDDASSDATDARIREFALGLDHSVVSILRMSYFQGMEMSMNAGKRLSIGDYVFEFDRLDVDYPTGLIYEVYQKALQGYDIVSASAKDKSPWTSRTFYSIFNRFSKVQYKLRTESFRVLSRRGINRIDASSSVILYRKAAYANCGLKCANIEYVPTNKKPYKGNKAQKKYREDLAIESLILHTDVAFKISSRLAAIMMAIAVFVLIYTVVIFLVGHPVAGWTTTMLVLSVGFFGMFAVLSIVIRYLAIMLNMMFKRQQVVYESIEKISK